ncbi:MAG: hypothetical protein MMC33_004823 [Icmadophila ericetorum]|nr:hypothetical protein [Icmadophila ericetorum]
MKRCRDEEDEQQLEELRNEHKKPRVLPFRASPTTRHTLLFSQARSQASFPKPPTLTPDLSFDEDDSSYFWGRGSQDANKYCTSSKQDTFSLHQITASSLLANIDPEEFDTDISMSDNDEEEENSSLAESPASPRWDNILNVNNNPSPTPSTREFPRPKPLSLTSSRHASLSSSCASTRIPTPIYGHFPSTSSTTSSSSTSPLASPPFQALSRPVLLPLLTKPIFYDRSFFNHISRRALPSPISEDEGIESPLSRTNASFSKFHVQSPVSTMPTSEQSSDTLNDFAEDMSMAGSTSEGRRGAVVGDAEGKKVVFNMG